MKRRNVLMLLGSLPLFTLHSARAAARKEQVEPGAVERLILSVEEWRKRLTPAQFWTLREEGTEPAYSSPFNEETRAGSYLCVVCDHPLFSSATKYDSGTGWPSFYDHLPNAFETRLDFRQILPRTEYHCARCGGHQGHLFYDGPKPTGQRYCNNGIALKFVAAKG
ncbi:MAG TPA: peptide-methionine (R)-S-oxide reductase MsrB [Gammaproteobacteria bacterium]